jgi:hypothetical protein
MPVSPSEPEKYSINEMMDRLKNAPPENTQDGELITRLDGTQVVRTRKRKRRSHQTQKEAAQKTLRVRIFQVSAVLVLLLATGLAVGAAIIYVNSSPFREKLIQGIQQDSGASAELIQFRMNPKTANAAQLSLIWPEGSLFKSLQLYNLNAEIFPSSFIKSPLNGEDISVVNAVLNLQFPKLDSPTSPRGASTAAPSVDFHRYRTRQLDVTLGDPLNPLISLSKSEGSLTPKSVSGRPQLSLYQGKIAIAGFPKLRLDRALIEFSQDEINFVGLRLLHEKDDRGSFEFSGKMAPYRTGQPTTLVAQLESFDLSGIIGTELSRLISGRIDSIPGEKSNILSFMSAEDTSTKLDIHFRAAASSHVEFQRFPFLLALSRLLDYPWFEHPTFENESSGILHRESGSVSLRDLNLESKSRIAIHGEVTIDAAQKLSGHLKVGVAESLIATTTSSRLKSLLSPPEDGFCWVTLPLGGTASSPTDTFYDLLDKVSPSELTPSSQNESSDSTFDQLTRPK